jgi:response regulator RpfG family c-di-GMP phosphodiesterase
VSEIRFEAVLVQIPKRSVLVLLVAASQLACMLIGLAWLAGWLAGDVGALGTVILALVGLVVTTAVIQRYENKPAQANERLEELVERRSLELMQTRDAVIFGLAKLADSRDDDTGEHLERIRAYVQILARELSRKYPGIDDQTIAMLGLTSSLHDLGKVGIPDAVLLKPGGLTAKEQCIVEKHPLIGGDYLLAIKKRIGDDDFLEIACEIAFGHHERWDGSGYPFGLHGDDIPLSARIVSLADVYDALTSKRVYKEAMSHEKARAVIAAGSATQFDPDIVEAFLAKEGEFAAIAASRGADHAGEGIPRVSTETSAEQVALV